MPNWCENEIRFEARSKEEINELVAYLKGRRFTQDLLSGEYEEEETEFSFNSVIPMPSSIKKNINDWRVEHWGTKWEPDVDMFDIYGDSLDVRLYTAWSPPQGIKDALEEKFPDIYIDWFYKEPGMQIAGWL
jgi:hypothetical protein